ncbi:hypothetical protein BS78_03G143500 [Paspalum vaginatum]|nr:hypothetical protein BS78_03G143500 [Paspalum vaginatum]
MQSSRSSPCLLPPFCPSQSDVARSSHLRPPWHGGQVGTRLWRTTGERRRPGEGHVQCICTAAVPAPWTRRHAPLPVLLPQPALASSPTFYWTLPRIAPPRPLSEPPPPFSFIRQICRFH